MAAVGETLGVAVGVAEGESGGLAGTAVGPEVELADGELDGGGVDAQPAKITAITQIRTIPTGVGGMLISSIIR